MRSSQNEARERERRIQTSGGVSWRRGGVCLKWKTKPTPPLLPPPPPLFSSLIILRSGLGGICRIRCESGAGIGIAKVIDRRHSGARIRLSMAAHKPVEWVQAIINRFDEQVKKTSVGRFDISRPKKASVQTMHMHAYALFMWKTRGWWFWALHWLNTIRACLDSGLMCCIWQQKPNIGQWGRDWFDGCSAVSLSRTD